MDQISAKKSLSAAMIAILLSCIGIALPYPILAPLFIHTTNELTTFAGIPPKILFGIVLAAYPLGVLIGSIFIGAISDIKGRKKVLTVTLILSALGYLGSAFALIHEHYVAFVLTRFITGCFEGNISVAKAIASDLSPTLDKTRTFSLINATGYAGWLIGPLLGGILEPLGIVFVFNLAAFMTIIATIFVYILLPSDDRSLQIAVPFKQLLHKQNSLVLLKNKAIKHLFIIYFLATLGLNAFYEFYPLLLAEYFSYSSLDIGIITVILTSSMILTSVLVVTNLKRNIGLWNGSIFGLFALSISLFIHYWVSPNLLMPYYVVIGVAIALFNGFIPVYILERFNHVAQGQLMGLLTTTFSLGNIVMAILGSVLALVNTYFSIIFGAILVMSSVIYFYLLAEKRKKLAPV